MILDASYDAKTLDELQAEFVQLGTQYAAIGDKRQALLALIDKRKAEARAAAAVGSLNDIEKEALRAALESRGAE